jgi:hypothetical protein
MAGNTDTDMKDHYVTLGLSPGASLDVVTSSYRHLAIRHHPDKNGGSKEATERFKSINSAFFAIQCALRNKVNKHGGAHEHDDNTRQNFTYKGCQVTENRGSITINFSSDLYQAWEDILTTKYGAPSDLGSKGLKFSSLIEQVVMDDDEEISTSGTVFVTLYHTQTRTRRMHVQGRMYLLWLSDDFQSLCDRLPSCEYVGMQAVGCVDIDPQHHQPQKDEHKAVQLPETDSPRVIDDPVNTTNLDSTNAFPTVAGPNNSIPSEREIPLPETDSSPVINVPESTTTPDSTNASTTVAGSNNNSPS